MESHPPGHWGAAIAAILTLLTAAPSAVAREGDDLRRGPAALRDEHLLAQSRLTLPAVAPDTVASGRWQLRLAMTGSSSFSWRQDVPGEHPEERWFLVDGEARTLDLQVSYGIVRGLDLTSRVPLRWRGPGMMDGVIATWHRWFDLPSQGRGHFARDAFRVEGRTTAHQPFSWNGAAGTGFGNVELAPRWRVRDGGRDGWSAALVGRLELPTGTAPFDADGLGAGAQLVAARRMARPLDVFVGLGVTAQDAGPVRGIAYEPRRAHGFVAVEWRLGRRLSLVSDMNAATRLVKDVDGYAGLHWLLNVSSRIDLSRRVLLEIAFTENIADQDSTTDFGVHAGFVVRP